MSPSFFFNKKVERVKVPGTLTRGGLPKSHSWHLYTCEVSRFSTTNLDKLRPYFICLFVILFPFCSERIDQLKNSKKRNENLKNLCAKAYYAPPLSQSAGATDSASGPSCCHADAIDASASVIDTVASLPQDCGFCKTTRLECELFKQLDLLDKAERFWVRRSSKTSNVTYTDYV